MILDPTCLPRLRELKFEISQLKELNSFWDSAHRPQNEDEVEAMLNVGEALKTLKLERSKIINESLRAWSGYKSYAQRKAEMGK